MHLCPLCMRWLCNVLEGKGFREGLLFHALVFPLHEVVTPRRACASKGLCDRSCPFIYIYLFITPRAHARARGYVIGRVRLYIYIYIYISLSP